MYGEATVIVGASKAHKRIGSSASFAKYCARKLSKYFGVFAVNNGKVVFQRAATSTNAHQLRGYFSQIYIFFFILKINAHVCFCLRLMLVQLLCVFRLLFSYG